MSRQIEPWVEDALHGLAADDVRLVVPSRVEQAVMEAWDRHAVRDVARVGRPRARVGVLVGAAAAVVLAAVWLQRPPAPATLDASAAGELGYVLVPDALTDPGSLHVVRLQMPRSGLARLGWPLVNPDADGLVEVELLVGEDGVARSIRRAALVRAEINTGGRP